MSIELLTEFSATGAKNTDGLNLASGFPSAQKPARQWFNWLFNAITKKLNQLATTVNEHDTRFTQLADAIWHVNSWHGTNSTTYNPATALEPFFGYQTTWYLWPHVPVGVANTSASLGQIVSLALGNGTQAMTTRIWQRLPDGAMAPTYNLSANKTTTNEGEQVVFTLSTAGVPQGSLVDWNITGIQSGDISPSAMSGQFTVGADGTATYTVSVIADVLAEGVETLVFALTYIANKSVSVSINDTSKPNYRTETYLGNKSSASLQTLIVQPSETLIVKMQAAGAGGGSSYSVGVENKPNATAASPITLTSSQTPSIQINGGQPGTNGVWGTSSSYNDGEGGEGGVSTPVANLTIQNGQNGFATVSNHAGGGSGYGKGGNGGNGLGDNGLAFGGGGGEGGYGEYTYTNNTGSDITFYLSIGAAGLANCVYPDPDNNQFAGRDGEPAQVIIEWNTP